MDRPTQTTRRSWTRLTPFTGGHGPASSTFMTRHRPAKHTLMDGHGSANALLMAGHGPTSLLLVAGNGQPRTVEDRLSFLGDVSPSLRRSIKLSR
ncbi:hypothetical protein Dimus_007828, partial [Dionaea muscipula]